MGKDFDKAMKIQQVGAKPIMTKEGLRYQLGGGIFTEEEIVNSRDSFGKAMLGKKR